MFNERVEAGTALASSLKGEATAIRGLLVTELGEDSAQKVGSIENLIRKARRLIRMADLEAWIEKQSGS